MATLSEGVIAISREQAAIVAGGEGDLAFLAGFALKTKTGRFRSTAPGFAEIVVHCDRDESGELCFGISGSSELLIAACEKLGLLPQAADG